MKNADFIFSSESVTEGHPDKLCDIISDAIVDRVLQKDPLAQIRAECAVFTNVLFLAVKFSTVAPVDFSYIARQIIKEVGYTEGDFNAKTCSIVTSYQEVPVDGSTRIDESTLEGDELNRVVAHDQATVFGFACDHNSAYMPHSIWLAHKLARRLTSVYLQGLLPYLQPDGKTQVSVEFKKGAPVRVHSITILASQGLPPHKGGPSPKKLYDDLMEYVIIPAFQDEEIKPGQFTKIFVNPEGPIAPGGPSIHSGLTGRKLTVDTYGGFARHMDSALSGKDPSRVDRIGAYFARYVAKNIVASGIARACEVQLSYSIGSPEPVSINIETFGTSKISERRLLSLVREVFDFRVGAIIKNFKLRELPSRVKGGFYRKLAAFGQVGRMDMSLPWERTDRAEDLKSALS
jgi:S-adenosylmethionine synthetase